MQKQDTNTAPGRQSPFPVVGIGASAGGLEPLLHFFKTLSPDTGMAFVVIQHLSPAGESILPGLISQVTRLPVRLIGDAMSVAPDTIFIVAPGTMVSLEGDVFKASHIGGSTTLLMPIDAFFDSLAASRREQAIAVVLSGRNADGTAGLKAVRENGGITFAQDESSARCGEMPRSAARYADFVMPPVAIAAKLAELRRTHGEQFSVDTDALAALFTALQAATGMDFSNYKRSTVVRRISRRMLFRNISALREYVSLLQNDRAEAQTLYQDLLINVTSFFRDRELFETLREKILPELLRKKKNDEPIRVWTAGCSTGEEVYSLAMLFAELLGEEQVKGRLQIFATDVNEHSLKKARSGLYRHSIEASVSRERRERFFTPAANGYQINKLLRGICTFVKHNVLRDPPFSRIDLASCRNLLIYMAPPLQKKALAAFHYALNHGGILVLGSSETVTGLHGDFVLDDKKNNIYSNQKSGAHVPLEYASFNEFPHDTFTEEHSGLMDNPFGNEFDMRKEIDAVILDKYAPPAIVVNEGLDVIQFRGNTGKFIEHASGRASLHLLKVLKKDLIPCVHSAINKAKTGAVQTASVSFRHEEGFLDVAVEVVPLALPNRKGSYFLVLFREPEAGGKETRERSPGSPENAASLSRLEAELSSTKEYLQAVIEEKERATGELKLTYEEIQSSNEELRSTNEELETSKEELQSANEELTTVNEELQGRNAEILRANDDLTNLLRSIDTPILVLGRELNIRHFTPASEKLLNLIASDIGRPFGNINHRINVKGLEGAVRSVIKSLTIYEQEVQDAEGHCYLMRLRPYVTKDGNVDGAVLAFFDIHAIMQAEAALMESEERYRSLFDTMSEGFALHEIICDDKGEPCDYRFLEINPAFERLTGLARETVVGSVVSAVLPGIEPYWIKNYGEVALTGKPLHFENYSASLKRYYEVYAYRPAPRQFATLFIDVTERRKAEEALKKSERQYRDLLETANSIILRWSPGGKIHFINEFGLRFFGYSRDELTGHDVTKITPEVGKGAGITRGDLVMDIAAHPDRHTYVPSENVRKDGSIVCVAWTRKAILDEQGGVTEILTIGSDITKIRQAEEVLKRDNETLEKAVKEKTRELVQAQIEVERSRRLSDIGVLAATIAHELRSPLAAIKAAAFNINRKAGGPLIQNHLSNIDKKIHESDQIIQNLLSYSCIRSPNYEKISVTQSLCESIGSIQAKYSRWNVVVAKQLTLPADEIIEADPVHLQMLFGNILDNAFQSLPDKTGTVTVKATKTKQGGAIRVLVRDTGTGIEKQHLKRLFEPFFTTKSKGIGLGLTLCNQIVQLHRGTIKVTSAKDKGTTVALVLPARRGGA